MNTITTDELKSWIDAGKGLVLLDVLGADAFAELHLPGAQNACVYEMTFLDQVEAAKDATIVVYGSSANSLDAADACARLAAAGYTDVHCYTGGRAAWVDAGHAVVGTATVWEPNPPVVLPDGACAVATESSYIDWTGRNVGNRHYGTLGLSEGTVTIRDGALAGGSFTIDMNTLAVGDLEGEMAATLIRHLEHEDFFAVDRYPTGRVEISSVTRLRDVPPGAPNHEVTAAVTLRGRTESVQFAAAVWPKGDQIALQANFDIDRTRWGVNYGSGKLYERLGMHLVSDLITLQICVVCG